MVFTEEIMEIRASFNFDINIEIKKRQAELFRVIEKNKEKTGGCSRLFFSCIKFYLNTNNCSYQEYGQTRKGE